MSPISIRICVPNFVAVRRSCRKGGGGTDRHTDTQTHKGTLQLYIADISVSRLYIYALLDVMLREHFRGTMNFGAMSQSVNAVSEIPAVNSNRDIIYFSRNSRVMFHEKNMPTM